MRIFLENRIRPIRKKRSNSCHRVASSLLHFTFAKITILRSIDIEYNKIKEILTLR